MIILRTINKKDVSIIDNWIHVQGVGTIGLYSPSKRSILLDYSMKWIVGKNENIPCTHNEIEEKIVNLFNDKKL